MPAVKAKSKDAAKVLSSYEAFFQNDISILSKAREGLKPEAVFDFLFIAGFSTEQLENALNKSMKTFQNYRERQTNLDVVTSEKLLRLFALYKKGTTVFGSFSAFTNWLSKPAYGIGNKVPQTLLDTMTGLDLINEELIRIEFGDLA